MGIDSTAIETVSEPAVDHVPVVALSPKAAKTVAQLMAQQTMTPLYLRVRVVNGGCVGFQHKLDLDPEVSAAEDHIFNSAGIKVAIWKRQVEMLRGVQIDYIEDAERQGFSIKNPNFEGEAVKKWLPVLAADVFPENRRDLRPLSDRIDQFRKMAKDDPDNELAHFRLGQLLMEDSQYAAAVKSCERALELSPQFSKVYQMLGECLIKLDQKDRAIEVLTKGCAVASKHGDESQREAMAKLLTSLGAAISPGAEQPR